MLDKIRSLMQKYNMVSEGCTVICGLSGGADSMVLLHSMCQLSEELGILVEALHVNHCIRGKESDRDELFCKDYCEKIGIPFTVVICNVPEYAETHRLSLEEAARKMRYDAFKDYSSGKLIATAHNANDALETVLHNLIRGTALKGLTGIPPTRGNIIRPLLTVTREEIEAYAKDNSLAFVTDSTNLSDDYTRNKIRRRIIPIIKEINFSAEKTSIETIDALREENSFIEAAADKAFSSCRKENALIGLEKYHPTIRKRCIARLLSLNALPYSYDRLEAVDRLVLCGGKLSISKNLYFVSGNGILSLELIEPTVHTERSVKLQLGSNSIFDGITVIAELTDKIPALKQNVDINTTVYYIDYDKINGQAVLRSRRFGDKIRLAGRDFSSSVKKLINEKIPPESRDTLHFIEDGIGTIFAECLGTSERTSLSTSTKRVLKLTVERKLI